MLIFALLPTFCACSEEPQPPKPRTLELELQDTLWHDTLLHYQPRPTPPCCTTATNS